MSQNLRVPGVLVQKLAQVLPATATANLYTVSGGNVLVNGLIGVVANAVGAVATTLSLGNTAGGVASIATASAITSSPSGTFLAPVNSAGKGGPLLVAGAAFVAAPPFIINPFLCSAGNITWTTSAAAGAGTVNWYLWYTALDFDATVS